MNLLSKRNNTTDVNEMYVQSMGQLFKVTGLFASEDACNAYLEKRPPNTEGVIAVFGNMILVARFHASDVRIKAEGRAE